MIAHFEKVFDEPYPWDQYAQCLVRDFVAGGMENTGCTLMTLGSARGEPGSQDDLISHELAHQWFGDLVTCKTWAHIWLNEGWASYAEAVWNEHKGERTSADKARTAYQKTIRGFIQSQRARNRTIAPAGAAMVSNRYSNPDAVFTKAEDPYAKGALVLHMLRQRLGDELFWRATREYLNRYKFSVAETDDFRREMERVSGQNLQRFFDQWTTRCGLPRLNAEFEWDEVAKTLKVSIEQTQKIDYLNPAFALSLPVRVKSEAAEAQWFTIDFDTTRTVAVFQLETKPTQVTLDPNMNVIAAVDVKKDLAWWIEDLLHGPSYAAKIAAAEYLAGVPDKRAQAALTRAAADQLEDDTVREAAWRGVGLTVAGK